MLNMIPCFTKTASQTRTASQLGMCHRRIYSVSSGIDVSHHHTMIRIRGHVGRCSEVPGATGRETGTSGADPVYQARRCYNMMTVA